MTSNQSIHPSMDFTRDARPLTLQAAAAAAAALMLALCLLLKIRLTNRKKRNYPPIAGTIFHQFLNFHRLYDFQTDLSRRYKTFRILTPFCNYVYTVDPANVEYILRTNFTNYGKGYINYEAMNDLLGDGIFTVDGEKWRQQRKIASFEFSARVLRDYSSIVFKTKARQLAEVVAESAASSNKIDILDLLMKSTMDSIFRIGFGVELDTLSGSNEEGRKFAKAFDDSNSLVLQRFFDVFWKIRRILNIGSEAALKKNVKMINEFVYKQIDRKIEQMSQQRDEFGRGDILSRFLEEREKDPSNMSYTYLRDIILNFVIAGRDTTAGTLAWFFYALCKHPGVQEKVAQEVREATEDKEGVNIGEFVSCLTEEALNKMQYLHAVLTETLRLYPAVPQDMKLCFSDDTLPDGWEVRKGDMVDYCPYQMGRMRFLWGEDVEEFRPERWLDDKGNFVPESPFKFTAFQAGPRICLGKEFAYRQMKIFAATLLRFFLFKLWDEKTTVNYRPALTLQIDGGLYLRALQR